MKTYYIEYETPPLRSINWVECDAETEQQACDEFALAMPRSRIRKISEESPAFVKGSTK